MKRINVNGLARSEVAEFRRVHNNITVKEQKSATEMSGSVKERPLDEEQEQKYQELIDLLLVGGYFRARIAGLSRFDKVVGGMAWCITSSMEDLDVDLLFEEDLNLKQRM